MKQEVIKKLVEANIFNQKDITEIEYNNKSESDKLYLSFREPGYYGEYQTKYWQVDTKGLTPEEIDLLLKTDQTKNIRTIKNIAIFFAVLAGISLAVSIVSAISIANLF